MVVQADDGDAIPDRRACPHDLCSPHHCRRLDHSSINVFTRATDLDEVAVDRADEHAQDELGDEKLERTSRVLADDVLAASKGRIACPFVVYVFLTSLSETREKINAFARAID